MVKDTLEELLPSALRDVADPRKDDTWQTVPGRVDVWQEHPRDRFKRRMRMMDSWIPASEMYAPQYAPVLLAGLSAVGATLLAGSFRGFLHLQRKGMIMTICAGIMFPVTGLAIYHGATISEMMELRTLPCPVCYETRAILGQLGFGIAAPFATCTALSLYLSTLYTTEAIPKLQHRKEFLQFLGRLVKKPAGRLVYHVPVHIITAAVCMHFVIKGLARIIAKERATVPTEMEKRPLSQVEKIVQAGPLRVSQEGVPNQYVIRNI